MYLSLIAAGDDSACYIVTKKSNNHHFNDRSFTSLLLGITCSLFGSTGDEMYILHVAE